ncbi:MAG: hypothetical protein ACNA7Q_05695 [Rhodobacterales bacterium]
MPLPLPDNAFDAAACVGVLSYIEDAEALPSSWGRNGVMQRSWAGKPAG